MTTHASARLTTPVTERDHIEGPPDARVTLVEYGDYECPHCGRAYPIVEEIRQQFGDRLRFAFRNFPLTQVHAYAEVAAEAAEAAGAQGRFWEMHHSLFAHQNALDAPHLVQYAERLRMNAAQVAEALAAHTFRDRVREDFMTGVRSGVNGTPTFFINGMRHDAPFDLPVLSQAIEEAAGFEGDKGRAVGRS
jgi:protein-disulfide isomerase